MSVPYSNGFLSVSFEWIIVSEWGFWGLMWVGNACFMIFVLGGSLESGGGIFESEC